jgi:sugar phosphate isomerase/epimerase
MARVSIQMWTVRQEAERSLKETLGKLSSIGYKAIETAGLYGLSPSAMRAELAESGLELSSAHTRLPEKDKADETFAEIAELGAPAAFISMLPAESFADDDAIGRAADALNAVAPVAKSHGIELGYHNHWWEFGRGQDGKLAFDKFVQRLGPDVTLEVDTYWAQVAGVDAAELVRSLGDRVHYLHIKDGPIEQRGDNHTAVGDGKMDIDRVLGANSAVRWDIVELDGCEGDIWEKVRRSFEYLSARGLG